jgi:hypothetical protein
LGHLEHLKWHYSFSRWIKFSHWRLHAAQEEIRNQAERINQWYLFLTLSGSLAWCGQLNIGVISCQISSLIVRQNDKNGFIHINRNVEIYRTYLHMIL